MEDLVIFEVKHTGGYPEWYMNTSAPVNLTLNYYIPGNEYYAY